MVLDTLYKLGTFIGGIGVITGAITAVATLIWIQRRTLHANWLAGFMELYAEFWNDKTIAEVRLCIASDLMYETVRPIFSTRGSQRRNVLDSEANATLEKIDKFCSILVRLEYFNKTGMTDEERYLWSGVSHYWLHKINERKELADYIREYWPALRKLID